MPRFRAGAVMVRPYALPRSRLRAPLRGSTSRRIQAVCSPICLLCRSAQDDTDGSRAVGYSPIVEKATPRNSDGVIARYCLKY